MVSVPNRILSSDFSSGISIIHFLPDLRTICLYVPTLCVSVLCVAYAYAHVYLTNSVCSIYNMLI